MTAKEYREKEQITDANFWDGNEIDFNMVYEFAEEYHNEQLRLHSVSNRRELLIAYSKKIDKNLAEQTDIKIIEKFVDEFISNL